MELHERFKIIREHFKCSQREMSKKMGISPQAWLDYESDDPEKRKSPGAKVLMKLVNEFQVDGGWLLSGKGNMFSWENILSAELDESSLQKIIHIIENECANRRWYVSPEKKAKVISYAYKQAIEEVGDVEKPMIVKMLELAAVPLGDGTCGEGVI